MVGDTTYDITMARNAGVAAIGVAWGHHPAEDLAAFEIRGRVVASNEVNRLIFLGVEFEDGVKIDTNVETYLRHLIDEGGI